MNKRVIDTKVFKVLSYVLILWVVGFFSPYRNEKDVKFHVGQGMILTVFTVIMLLLVFLINRFAIQNIFVDKIIIGSGSAGKYVVNQTGEVIALILRVIVITITSFFSIVGLLNVLRGKDKFLPVIGKYSFINRII